MRYEFSARIEFKFFIVNISVTVDGSLLSPTGGVNTIHPEPEIHEHICVTKGYGTMCTYIETNVNNNVNNATHADELTVQH